MTEQREIKYQVWDIEMKTMLTWEEVLDEVECEGIHLMLAMLRQDHYIMLEFTGLIDATKREWIEGDICEPVEQCDTDRFEIVFEDGAFRKKYRYLWPENLKKPVIDPLDLVAYSVVGDIYRTPELTGTPTGLL